MITAAYTRGCPTSLIKLEPTSGRTLDTYDAIFSDLLPPHPLVAAPASEHLLLLYSYTLPECHAALDYGGRRFRVRVIPSSTGIGLAVHDYVVVSGHTLLSANCRLVASPEKIVIQRFRRKVVIAFNDDGVVAFRQDRSFPYCFRHVTPLVFQKSRPHTALLIKRNHVSRKLRGTKPLSRSHVFSNDSHDTA